jgi:sugar O-acyltransferase (sialic acid O-acetyltransferase NeuD family)
MKRLIIIGARNLGREVLSLAMQCHGYQKDWFPIGFLDSDGSLYEKNQLSLPIISSVEDYFPTENDVFICALGNCKAKKKYVDLMLERGGIFLNLIHPTTIIHENSNLEGKQGIIIQPHCLLSDHVIIEDFVTIQANSTIGHNTYVSKYCHISAYTFTGGGVQIEECVLTGTRSTLLPDIRVGKNAVVGACSLVTKQVPESTTVFGSPAVVIATQKISGE